MSTSTHDAVKEAVTYLETSTENTDAQVIAIQNAAESADVSIIDVLQAYIENQGDEGVVFRDDKVKVEQLIDSVEKTAGDNPDITVDDVVEEYTVIETQSDVVDYVISLYSDTSKTVEERQDKIKEIVDVAQEKGINVTAREVIDSLKEYKDQSTVTTSDKKQQSGAYLDEEVGEIKTPERIVTGEPVSFELTKIDDQEEIDISWSVSGSKKDTGVTFKYTFESPGPYTVSATVQRGDETVSRTTTVEVEEVNEFAVEIVGESVIEKGTVGEYSVTATNNITIDELNWEFDGMSAGNADTFSQRFSQATTHTLGVTATAASGDQATAEITIDVVEESDLSLDLVTPETAYINTPVTIECSTTVDSVHIDSVTCKIDGEVVAEEQTESITVQHTFTEPGDYAISVTATTETGESETVVNTVTAGIEPRIELLNELSEFVSGQTVTVQGKKHADLETTWDVNNASLIRVNDSEATIEVNEEVDGDVVISVTVKNSIGETASDTLRVPVVTPVVDMLMTVDEPVISEEPTTFSVTDSHLEHAEFDRVEWYLGDERVGAGESFVHTFPEPGTYTVRVEGETNVDISDTVTREIEVTEAANVTPVALVHGGTNTNDTFVLDASKSIVENVTVEQYKWGVEDLGIQIGETVDVQFPTPKEYDVKLIITTEEGIRKEDTTTVTVNEYRDVSAVIDGPENVLKNEEATFSASNSDTENTVIDSYEWFVNNEKVATGEEFSQVFDSSGHYTVRVEVTTETGEKASTTHSVTVSTPDAEVDAVLDIESGSIVVGEEVILTAENSEVVNGEITRCTWVIDGEEHERTTQTVRVTFEEYGERPVSVTVETGDKTRDSVTRDVYVSPSVRDPPYKELRNESQKGDVLEQALQICEDAALTPTDKNRFITHLVRDAHYYDIDITVEEVEDHIADAATNDDVIGDIDLYSVEPERSDRNLPPKADETWDLTVGGHDIGGSARTEYEGESELEFDEESETDSETGDSDTVSWIYDSDDWTIRKYYSNRVAAVGDVDVISTELSITDEVESITEEDLDETISDADNKDGEGEDTDDSDPNVAGEEVVEDADGSAEEELDIVNPDADLDDVHTRGRVSPETYDLGDSVFAMPNYTQDLVDFEFILEGDEPYAPDGVNNAGVVVVEDGELYVAIAKVQARDWSIHTASKKRDIAKAYEQHFINGLDNPIQIVSVPVQFELREHVKRINDVLKENEDDPEELLMNIGRSIYPNWLESFMQENDLKEKEFYLVVPFRADYLSDFKQDDEGMLASLTDAPVVGNLVDRFIGDDWSSVTRYQCLRELNSRLNDIESNLRRINVGIERVSNRDEALAVLFHYYNGDQPEMDVFPTGPFTEGTQEETFYGEEVNDIGAEFESNISGVDDSMDFSGGDEE